MQDNRVNLPELATYRIRTAQRRAKAFSGAREFVLGAPVLALTPATFSKLYSVGSPFVCGGRPTELDVRHYVWFHSPLYSTVGKRFWWVRKKVALFRLVVALGGWRRLLLLRPNIPRYVLQLTTAIAEIEANITNAFADSPPASGRPGKPLATLEAYFMHEFATGYRWLPERTSATPLRELIQLHRCIRAARGEEVADDGEEKIWADHLRKRNAELAAQRKESHG
jgi:hypothetical protein